MPTTVLPWTKKKKKNHSLIGVSFECPYQHPPWYPVSIGRPAPKIHQWTIYFCRWGFGWVEKAQCFRSARRFGAAGLSQDFSRVFHGMALLGLCLETFFKKKKRTIVVMHHVISKTLQPDFAAMHRCVKSRQSQVAFARGSAAESSTLIPRYHKILILCISSMVLFFCPG